MSPPVRLEQLEHDYGAGPVLSIEAYSIPRGRVHLAGANGAGKTTLLGILATLITPTSGRVDIAGHRLPEQARAVRGMVGYAGHAASLHDELQARHALEMHARLHCVASARVDRALRAWGLSSVSHAPVSALSHGQRRRLDLARALLHEPSVVLLDEPATGLDAAGKRVLDERLTALSPDLAIIAAPDAPGLDVDAVLSLSRGRLGEGSA